MKKDKNSIFKQGRGYTFVEMIVILSILLILISAAAMTFVDLRAKSKDIGEKAIIATLQLAINQYYSKYMVWPNLDTFNSDAKNPFTLMKYPPPLQPWSYTNGDGKEKWAICDDGGTDYIIVCPHADIAYCISPGNGNIWKYFTTGANAGKIKLLCNNGH